MVNILPLILCRGGSKSIPRKNIKLLNGKPLLWYALTEAQKVFPQVYLSTDDTEIAEVAMRFGARILARPLQFAQDESKSVDTVKYHLKTLQGLEGKFDAILLVNACTPFVKSNHMREAIKLFLEKKADSVVSLVPDFSAHPSKLCYLAQNGLIERLGDTFETGERQALKPLYKRNTAIYISKREVVESRTFFGSNTYGYVMKPEDSLDLNTLYDWYLAELILHDQTHKEQSSN